MHIYSKYEKTVLDSNEHVSTFDLVLVQLYESYSHLSFNVTQLGQEPTDYLIKWTPLLQQGYLVNFGSDPKLEWPTQTVQVPASALLVGFGNGWTGGLDNKNVLVLPEAIGYSDPLPSPLS